MTDYDYSSDFDADYVTRGEAKTVARQEVAKTLADISQFSSQAAAGVQHAIEEVASKHADFKERIPQMQAVLKEEPVLADAISQAESNPNLQNYLDPLYKLAYRLSQSPSQPDSTPTQHEPESARPSGLSEESIFAGTQASKQISLSPSNRKQLIASLEERGVLDVES